MNPISFATQMIRIAIPYLFAASGGVIAERSGIISLELEGMMLGGAFTATLGAYSDADIFARLQRIREGAITDSGRSPKLSEFDVFASGRPEIGQNHPSAKLYAHAIGSRGAHRIGRARHLPERRERFLRPAG